MRNPLLVLGVLALFACGGEEQVAPPPPPPPSPAPLIPTPPPVDTTAAAPPPKPPMADMQKAALMAAAAALNGHDANKLASLYADGAVIKVAGLNEVDGRDAVASNMQEWFDTFSQIKVGFRRVWMSNDVVVLEWALNGSYTGDFFGVKGKDQPIGHVGLSVLWFDPDGHVKEEHRYGDLGTVMQQVTKKNAPLPPAIPSTPDISAATGAADEAARLDAAKGVYGAMEKKSEADFLGALTDDVEYNGHLGSVKGKAEAKKFFQTFTKAFPDAKFNVTNGWAVGDSVIVEYELTGTHKGAILGIAPSNRPIDVHAVDVFKIADGKVSRASTYSNGMELMEQLSPAKIGPVVPPPAGAPKK